MTFSSSQKNILSQAFPSLILAPDLGSSCRYPVGLDQGENVGTLPLPPMEYWRSLAPNSVCVFGCGDLAEENPFFLAFFDLRNGWGLFGDR